MKRIYFFILSMFFCAAFSFAQGTFSVGILGNGVPGSPFAGPDLDMTNTGDDVNFTLFGVTLTTDPDGLKFRVNDDWATNWGNTNFPNGQGFLGGPNVSTVAGTYDIYLHIDANTGNATYSFQQTGVFPAVGVLGDAIVGNGFAGPDLNLTTADGIVYQAANVQMVSGIFKLRQDDDWTINWGFDSDATPGPQSFNNSQPGIFTATLFSDFGGSTTDISIDVTGTSGTFDISFNRHTGEITLTDSTLSLSDLVQNGVQARFVGNQLVVTGLNNTATISGYDLLGRRLFTVQRNLSGNFRETLPMPENQIGILKIDSPGFSKTLKVAAIR